MFYLALLQKLTVSLKKFKGIKMCAAKFKKKLTKVILRQEAI